MKAMKHEVSSIQFRSKLEARWNYFLGDYDCNISKDGGRYGGPFEWPIEYEPYLHDVDGYIPDFIIFGDKKKILVEVKPISYIKDFYEYEYKEFREKVKRANIFKKGYHLIIVGTRINFTPSSNKYFTFGIHLTDNEQLDKCKYLATFVKNGEKGGLGLLNPLNFKWPDERELSYEQSKKSYFQLKKELGPDKFNVEDLICDRYQEFNEPQKNWYASDDPFDLHYRNWAIGKWNGAGSLLQWRPKK